MRFAEKNHKLVYAFLQEQRYDPGEYYDLAVMGYLRAVERYCSHAYLRRFSFSTVAYRAMQQSIVSWKRGESRRRQAEEAYCALCGRRENVCDAELSEAYFFSELQKCGTPQQAAFALLRLHGYSIAEIAAQYKLDPRRVRRMLKSLYSAYLRFRGDGKEAKNEGSAHKDAPRAAAQTTEGRQQRAHRPRRAVYSDLAGHIHSGAK